MQLCIKKKILRIFSDEIRSYPICYKGDNDLYKFFKISSLNLDKLDSESQILDKIMLPNEKYKKFKNMFIKHPKSKNVQYSKLIKRIINLKWNFFLAIKIITTYNNFIAVFIKNPKLTRSIKIVKAYIKIVDYKYS